ncbi:MAG: hypothetical protein KatS3mg129_0872 [Leptospiraceae bacterium]|nr:MAG: hypothetical protein KatS3mg129_0872 [Leptospiraceae bacterium]
MINKNLKNIIKFEIIDHIKSKWFFIYSFIIFIFTFVIVYFSTGKPSEIIATITNFFLLVLPLFSMLFGIINFYESLSFQNLLMIRGISRKEVFLGKYLGILFSLILSFIIGILPIFLFYNKITNIIYIINILLIYSILLHAVFLSISFFISQIPIRLEIHVGIAILYWFIFYILYDSLIFFIVLGFGDYPIEPIILLLVIINPIDLIRTILLLHGDLSAIMTYSSALYSKELGNMTGIILGILILIIWTITFYFYSFRKFNKKDL